MDLFSLTAEAIGLLLHSISTGVEKFLAANYYTVAFLINIFHSVTNYIQETSLFIFDVFQCYFYDFLEFSNELGVGLRFIVSSVINFISKLMGQISQVLYYCGLFVNSLYVKALLLSNTTLYFLSQVFETIVYFIKVVLNAILLILQLGPNVLIFLYENIVLCSKQTLNSIQYASCVIWDNLYLIPSECQNAVLSVPPKAYFGIVLLACLFYFYKPIVKWVKMLCDLLVTFLASFMSIIALMIYTCFTSISSCMNAILFKSYRRDTEESAALESSSHSSFVQGNNSQNSVCRVYKYLKNKMCFIRVPFQKQNVTIADEQVEKLQKELHAEKDRRICVICHDRERNVLLYPCMHMCMCEECNQTFQDSFEGCPLCRQDILNTLHVYT